MNHRHVFFLTLLFLNNFIIGMENEYNHKNNLLTHIPSEICQEYKLIKPKMTDIKPTEKQWWYLDKEIKLIKRIKSICFNLTNTNLIITTNDKIATIFNLASNKVVGEFPSTCAGKPCCFDPSKNFFATCLTTRAGEPISTTQDLIQEVRIGEVVRIFDTDTNGIVASFEHPFSWFGPVIEDLSFNHNGTMLATAVKKTARIFKRYDNYTLEQLQLKQAMNTWLLIKKPILIVKSEKTLLEDLLSALFEDIENFQIILPNTEDELKKIWESFPPGMQQSILRTMIYKIQYHGEIFSKRVK